MSQKIIRLMYFSRIKHGLGDGQHGLIDGKQQIGN